MAGSGAHATLQRRTCATVGCRSDADLRTLLIQGAHSSLQRAKAVAI
jgi:hypothetical protein